MLPNAIPSKRNSVTFCALSLVTLAFAVAIAAPARADIYYVDDDAALGGDGTSWATAFRYLQDAMHIAQAGDQIRVAAGEYKPDQDEAGNVTAGDRFATFDLVSSSTLRGGYAGPGAFDPNEWNPEQYETVLSGDLMGNDETGFVNYGENSIHVIESIVCASDTVLSGMHVTHGYANVDNPLGYDYGAGLSQDGGGLQVEDCRFSLGLATYGGAARIDSSAVFCRCEFEANRATDGSGGAIICDLGNLVLIDCRFLSNRTIVGSGGYVWGGAVCMLWGSLEAINCQFVDNRAETDGGAIHTGWAETDLVNCVFVGNRAHDGGAVLAYGASPSVTNCVFHENEASYGEAINGSSTSVTITNSIFWDSLEKSGDESRGDQFRFENSTCVISYSCIENYYGQFGTLGNIDVNPLFRDPAGPDGDPGTIDDDLRLRPGSPCVDAADNSALPWDLYDVDNNDIFLELLPIDVGGQPRFVDDPNVIDTGNGTLPIVDMGAYEYAPPGLVVSSAQVVVPEGGTATFNIRLSAAPVEQVEASVAVTNGDPDIVVQSGAMLVFDETNYDQPQVVQLYAVPDGDSENGSATLAVSASGLLTIELIAQELDAQAPPEVIYVDASAAPGGDGESWSTAYADLQDALDAASPTVRTVEIWIAEGTYTPDRGTGQRSASFELKDFVTLYGGFAGSEANLAERDWHRHPTVLSGQLASGRSRHVVRAQNVGSMAVLDGCVVERGRAIVGYADPAGGGLLVIEASPVICNCEFRDNAGPQGAAVFARSNSSPTFKQSVFTDNVCEASSEFTGGGAMLIYVSDVDLEECVCAANSGVFGGAVNVHNGDAYVSQCIFLGNESSMEGGAIGGIESHITTINCLFVGNAGTTGALHLRGGEGDVIGSTFCDNSGGGIHGWYASRINLSGAILWYNTLDGADDEDAQLHVLESENSPTDLTINYSCVQGWTGTLGGVGNFGNDPMFVDADGPDDVAGTFDDDLRLMPGSPCIDAGDNTAVLSDWFDLDDDGDMDERTPFDILARARFCDDPNAIDIGVADLPGYPAIVDIGAYEHHRPGDLDGSQLIDALDFDLFLDVYGVCSDSWRYRPDADFDADGCITALDYQMWLVLYRAEVSDPQRQAPGTLPGDLNRDGQFNLDDLQVLLANYGRTTGVQAGDGDCDGDGDVDLADLVILLQAYGSTAG